MKVIVTAWQLRGDPDSGVVNDHSDADYDRDVLERLAALHADAMAWLTHPGRRPQPDWPTTASGSVAPWTGRSGGDNRFVASPRVDSYHGIWFELHEDLIRLAGRTREEESAAGRA